MTKQFHSWKSVYNHRISLGKCKILNDSSGGNRAYQKLSSPYILDNYCAKDTASVTYVTTPRRVPRWSCFGIHPSILLPLAVGLTVVPSNSIKDLRHGGARPMANPIRDLITTNAYRPSYVLILL